ncbi:MAG: adenosylhomocysteinase, partial [Solirubrobacterales bacterium]
MGVPQVAATGLAAEGQARIEWADAQMPVLRSIRERFASEQPLAGVRVAACLHVTAETANLMRALADGGADVALCAANPLSTRDEVAAALTHHHGIEVHAVRGEDGAAYAANVTALVDGRPQVTLDDGADLLSVLHDSRPSQLSELLGGTEETTTGLLRLRALEAEGRLACPVLAVNEARTERLFNDHYGTGQSTLDGILRATNLLLAGRTIVVLGYGFTGKGVAMRARGAGAQVVVCEVDPMRALEARMEGFEVMPALEAASRGDVFVTVTGSRDVLTTEHFARMKDGAVLANAGHFDIEIDLPALREAATERLFNDHYGTGQSTLDGILRATNLLLAGRTIVVLGYGFTGKGVAMRARGAGAQVILCEIDPMRALEARMEGFEVMPALRAAERGDVFVTVTGSRDALTTEHFARMKDGAVLANAGHFDIEID